MVISGIWHGAAWTFVIWGALHALGRCLTRELEQTQAEIAAGSAEDAIPGPHSPAWRRPRRPRARKQYYPVGRR